MLQKRKKRKKKKKGVLHLLQVRGRSPRPGCEPSPAACSGLTFGPPLQHLTKSLLAVAFLSSFGSSMLYGYNLAVVNSPSQVGVTGGRLHWSHVAWTRPHHCNVDLCFQGRLSLKLTCQLSSITDTRMR